MSREKFTGMMIGLTIVQAGFFATSVALAARWYGAHAAWLCAFGLAYVGSVIQGASAVLIELIKRQRAPLDPRIVGRVIDRAAADRVAPLKCGALRCNLRDGHPGRHGIFGSELLPHAPKEPE